MTSKEIASVVRQSLIDSAERAVQRAGQALLETEAELNELNNIINAPASLKTRLSVKYERQGKHLEQLHAELAALQAKPVK